MIQKRDLCSPSIDCRPRLFDIHIFCICAIHMYPGDRLRCRSLCGCFYPGCLCGHLLRPTRRVCHAPGLCAGYRAVIFRHGLTGPVDLLSCSDSCCLQCRRSCRIPNQHSRCCRCQQKLLPLFPMHHRISHFLHIFSHAVRKLSSHLTGSSLSS